MRATGPEARGSSPAGFALLVFLVVGGLWILLGEWLAPRYHVVAHVLAVAVTGGLIWWIVDRQWKDRVRLERKYHQIQRLEAIGRLAGGIAHDFNNLLTVITGYTQFALEEASTEGSQRRDLETVREAADKARNLNRQILTFSRQQPMELTSVRLDELLESTLEMARRTMPGVEIEVDLDEDMEPVRADAAQVEQVLLNLVMNAHDALEQGTGRIRVETARCSVTEPERMTTPIPMRPDVYARLTVSDDGCGMDEATLQHLFEPFFTTKEDGTGLGLATSYGIVKRHDGYIWARSEPGGGSTFDVYLPLTAPTEEESAPAG